LNLETDPNTAMVATLTVTAPKGNPYDFDLR